MYPDFSFLMGLLRPSDDAKRKSSLSHCRGLGSIPEHSMWDGQSIGMGFFFEYFGFTHFIPFHLWCHSSFWVLTFLRRPSIFLCLLLFHSIVVFLGSMMCPYWFSHWSCIKKFPIKEIFLLSFHLPILQHEQPILVF